MSSSYVARLLLSSNLDGSGIIIGICTSFGCTWAPDAWAVAPSTTSGLSGMLILSRRDFLRERKTTTRSNFTLTVYFSYLWVGSQVGAVTTCG